MNMLVLRTGDDIIVIDAGMMFPEAELLGVDGVVPDITYLMDNRELVRGIILTHGHEDHIGAFALHSRRPECSGLRNRVYARAGGRQARRAWPVGLGQARKVKPKDRIPSVRL